MEKQYKVNLKVENRNGGIDVYEYAALPEATVVKIRDAVVNADGVAFDGAAFKPGEIRQAFWSENEGEDGEE